MEEKIAIMINILARSVILITNMLKCLVFVCAAATVLARTMPTNKNTVDQTTPEIEKKFEKYSSESSLFSDFSVLYKMYQTCSNMDVSVCLKLKLLGMLDKASRSLKELELFEGVKFITADSESDTAGPILSENELIEQLPRSMEDKENALTTMIWNKIVSFFQRHTLQVKFPSEDDIKRSMTESRKKKKEKGALIMIPLLLGGTFIPIAYGALALLSGKALIVSKLALVLASIIGIKKLVSHSSGHHESSHEVVVSGGHGGSGWGRDFDLVYNAYIPKDRTQSQM